MEIANQTIDDDEVDYEASDQDIVKHEDRVTGETSKGRHWRSCVRRTRVLDRTFLRTSWEKKGWELS